MFAFADKPSPPKNLKVTAVSETSVGLCWDEPSDDGGAEITGYIVEKHEANKRSWNKVDVTTSMEYTVEKLTEKNEYFFRVAAQNDVGTSEFVELKQAVMAKSQYGKEI